MNKLLLLIVLFFATGFYAEAQCPFGKTNCLGECGRFTDENGDGFCDFGLVTEVKQTSPDSIPVKNQTNTEKQKLPIKTEVKHKQDIKIAVIDTVVGKNIVPVVENSDSPETIVQEQPEKENSKPYDFLSISIITIVLYILSMCLVKMKKLKKATHRKIWNVILLFSFLVSGILGLVLVVQINYGIAMSAFRDFLFLHVEFGIVMAIIAVIHAFWHLNYYIKMFSKK